MRGLLANVYFAFLVLSPLFYLGGSADYVTPLVISNFVKIPSLSVVNYSFLLLFILCYFYTGTLNNAVILSCLVVLFLLVSLRSSDVYPFYFSLLSQIVILSPLAVFLLSPPKSIFLKDNQLAILLKIYIFYCVISIVIHFAIVSVATSLGVYFPNDRMVGIFKNPNHMAAFAIVSLMFLYSYILFINTNDMRKWVVFFVEIIVFVCVFLSGSRSSLVFLLFLAGYFNTFFRLSKLKIYFFCFFALIGVIYSINHFSSFADVIALFAKRDIDDLDSAGNMRWVILKDFINSFSSMSLLFGEGSGQGTAIFIKMQNSFGNKVTWLDSNVNSIIYTYGLPFFFLVYFCMISLFFRAIICREYIAVVYAFMCYFVWFFNIAEYFPIIFVVSVIGSICFYYRGSAGSSVPARDR